MFRYLFYIIVLFQLHTTTNVVVAVGPGSPNWDEILSSPIADIIPHSPSPQISSEHVQTTSPVAAAERAEMREHESSNIPTSPINIHAKSANALTNSPEWYAARKVSMHPRAIKQRERIARLKEENIDVYKETLKRNITSNRKRRNSLEGEEKDKNKKAARQTQKRYEERRRQAFKLPENIEKAKEVKERRRISSRESKRRFMKIIKSGKGTPEQVALYLKRKKATLDAKRRSRERKAQRDALNSPENN